MHLIFRLVCLDLSQIITQCLLDRIINNSGSIQKINEATYPHWIRPISNEVFSTFVILTVEFFLFILTFEAFI